MLTILGSSEKKPISADPFVVFFDYGKNREGYWTYDHFILQCEDVFDCLHVLYPEFRFALSVDHSCGHDRGRPNGLAENAMNVHFGGKQCLMHGSKILEKEGYLGPFPSVLQVGDVQSFIFTPTDSGPFYLTSEEREQRRHTRTTGKTKKRAFNKKEESVVEPKSTVSIRFYEGV